MKRFARWFAAFMVVSLLCAPAAIAHTPLGAGSNESLASATPVPDPTKSWAIYAELHQGGEAQYYRLEMRKGQRIHVSLFTTTAAEDATFTPSLILMGGGLTAAGSVPGYLEVPPGVTAMAVDSVRTARATYEPFSPSAYFRLADITVMAPADGTYHVAVADPERGGNYGLAIGERETTTLAEWVTNPLAFPSIYLWEHESPLVVLSPMLAVLLAGVALLVRPRTGRRLDATSWVAALAGLIFVGTAATTLVQMLLSLLSTGPDAAAIVTLLLAAAQAGVGWATLRLAVRRSGAWTSRSRLYLVLAGLGAIMVWAGYVVGPALALAAAARPSKPAVPVG
jgi:hypothetical protein